MSEKLVTVLISGYVSGFQGLTDGQMKVSFTASGLESDDFSKTHELQSRGNIWCLLSSREPGKEVIEAIEQAPAPEDQEKIKSQGQKLRASLFILWQKLRPNMTSEELYNVRMQKFRDDIRYEIEQLEN